MVGGIGWGKGGVGRGVLGAFEGFDTDQHIKQGGRNTLYFWAKTTEEGIPGISVFQHMVDVGYVAQYLAETSPNLLCLFKLRSQEIGALAALHDIGKISPGFQRKCMAWFEKNGLQRINTNWGREKTMESDHGKISHTVIQQFLNSQGISRKISSNIACLLGAHHGRLSTPNERGYWPQQAISETESGIDWDKERQETAEKIWEIFNADKEYFHFEEESPAFWWLAGLTTIADWIGSDEHYFPPTREANLINADPLAQESITAIGLQQPVIHYGLSFFDLFGFHPNDMQCKALSVITAPGVYVIEAPMGMGKTEAALGAAYQLLCTGKAKGIYFALPTQATSNRIHLRMNEFIRKISPESPSTKLIHGNSWLMTSESEFATRIGEKNGRDWFMSAKKALVAPFGVGTIDQALLGVVAAKHFFVRHFALAGKVVILDEVHSYDLYTGTLIDKLIATLEHLGCTVIILSATLTSHRRMQLLSAHGNDGDLSQATAPYPLISGRRKGLPIQSVDASPPPARDVRIGFIRTEDAEAKAIKLATKGGTALWICDTVDSAQATYLRLKVLCDINIKLGLLHSRFPFWRRGELENEWMERLGKDGNTRCGCILVSTQIVEQSVDLDADLIISELAPMDMLLQRMGRVWRHTRNWRPNPEPQFLIIEEAAGLSEFKEFDALKIKSTLGGKAYVYAPYVLLRTLDLWRDFSSITIPGDIRRCIESTYAEMEDEPASWTELFNDWFGNESAKKTLAEWNTNLWLPALDDKEGVQTRLNEMPTVSLVLCSAHRQNLFSFIDGTEVTIEKSKYSLKAAQTINKNLVKIPRYCFRDKVIPCDLFSEYIYGEQTIGIVSAEGFLDVSGLQKKFLLSYTSELGLVITKVIKEGEL